MVLSPYDHDAATIEAFKASVLAHLKTLPSAEWSALRALGQRSLTPEQLVEEATTESYTHLIPELSVWPDQVTDLAARIDGQPVRYIQGQGIYLWSRRPRKGPYLTLWVTHPGYPPGW